jgi:hypothetical protein
MQRRGFWFVLLPALVSVLAAGCDDLGTCDDPARGRTTVKVGTTVMYAGQAIMLRSCANGCHSSGAKGAFRRGAPAGLDFDLNPIEGSTLLRAPDGGVVAVTVDGVEASGLRARQRTVFDERELIWEQVDKGLMPPESGLKALIGIVRAAFASDGTCPETGELGNLDNAKPELRNWLACGTPIVETNSPELPLVVPATTAAAQERAAGAAAYAGATGYQLPACKGGGGGTSFEDVYDDVFVAEGCSAGICHGGSAPIAGFDLGTIDKAYASLLGAGQGAPQTCGTNTDVYVKPGDPDGSYIMAKIKANAAKPPCGGYMPNENGASAGAAALLRAWIMEGALRRVGGAASGDAGMGDAGMSEAGI